MNRAPARVAELARSAGLAVVAGVAATVAAAGLAACQGPVEPEAWQLDQDRVLGVRATPPRIAAGEHAMVDGLRAHAGGATTVDAPSALTAPHSPLFAAVNFVFDHWEVIAPDEAALADARAQLGLAPGAPILVELDVYFGPLSGVHLTTHKQIWLGDTASNPELPAITVDGRALVAAPDATPEATLAIGRGADHTLAAAASDVSWFSSCGVLRDATELHAVLHADEPCTGELAVVSRDGRGGTVWHVWPLAVE